MAMRVICIKAPRALRGLLRLILRGKSRKNDPTGV